MDEDEDGICRVVDQAGADFAAAKAIRRLTSKPPYGKNSWSVTVQRWILFPSGRSLGTSDERTFMDVDGTRYMRL